MFVLIFNSRLTPNTKTLFSFIKRINLRQVVPPRIFNIMNTLIDCPSWMCPSFTFPPIFIQLNPPAETEINGNNNWLIFKQNHECYITSKILSRQDILLPVTTKCQSKNAISMNRCVMVSSIDETLFHLIISINVPM